MKRKGVAAALSGLVFPGVGQYYLGRKLLALLFIGVALVSMVIYFNYQLDTSLDLANQVMGGKLALDPAAMEAKLQARPTPPSVTLAGWVFLLCWIGSVVEIVVRPKP